MLINYKPGRIEVIIYEKVNGKSPVTKALIYHLSLNL